MCPAHRLKQAPRNLGDEGNLRHGRGQAATSRGHSLSLGGLAPLHSHTKKWQRIPFAAATTSQAGLFPGEHLLSKFYVPGTALGTLHALPTAFLLGAFEVRTVFDPNLQTRKLSQRS